MSGFRYSKQEVEDTAQNIYGDIYMILYDSRSKAYIYESKRLIFMDGRIEFRDLSESRLNRIIAILKENNEEIQIICNAETGTTEEVVVEADNYSLYIY
jgi:hypothetical protein